MCSTVRTLCEVCEQRGVLGRNANSQPPQAAEQQQSQLAASLADAQASHAATAARAEELDAQLTDASAALQRAQGLLQSAEGAAAELVGVRQAAQQLEARTEQLEAEVCCCCVGNLPADVCCLLGLIPNFMWQQGA